MTRKPLTLVTFLMTVAAAPLIAQAPTTRTTPFLRWGPQISYEFNAERVGIGGRLEHSLTNLLGGTAIDGIGELNVFLGDVTAFDMNYNIVYRFAAPSVTPYLGGGLNFTIITDGGGSNLHINGLAGLRFKPAGRITPVLQLRYVFAGDGDAIVLTAGALF